MKRNLRESNFLTLVEQHLPESLKAIKTPFRRKNTVTTKPTKTAVDLVSQSTSPLSRKCFTKLVCYLSLISFSTVAPAGSFQDDLDDALETANAGTPEAPTAYGFAISAGLLQGLGSGAGIQAKAASKSISAQYPSTIYHGAYLNDTTYGYTTEVGEPLLTGMTHTLWRYYVPSRNERVVFNTYGSTTFISPYGELDTQLAVYRIDNSDGASGFKSYKRVAANDNKKITGGFSLGSLVTVQK